MTSWYQYSAIIWPSRRLSSPAAGWLSWWRHQMEKISALLALCARNSPVSGEVPTQRPVPRSFDVFFDLRLNKRLSKQLWNHHSRINHLMFSQNKHPSWQWNMIHKLMLQVYDDVHNLMVHIYKMFVKYIFGHPYLHQSHSSLVLWKKETWARFKKRSDHCEKVIGSLISRPLTFHERSCFDRIMILGDPARD